MSINVIYIPVDGNIYIKSDKNEDLFNNIGDFIALSKNNKLDTISLYQNESHLYELIVNDSKENQSINKYASKLKNEEIVGNAVLIKQTENGLESIDNLNIINEIEFNINNIKFVEIDNNNIKQHICLKTDLNKTIQNLLETNSKIKKSCVFNYKLFGYSFEIYSKHDTNIEINQNANILLESIIKSEDIKQYVKNLNPENELEENELEENELEENELEENAEENAEKTTEAKEEQTAEAKEEEREQEITNNNIYGKAFIINKDEKNFTNITIDEIKKLLLI